LVYGQEKVLALKLNGQINDVSNLSLDVSVENSASCIKPLEIDIFDDGFADWRADKFGTDFVCTAGASTGCFNANESLSDVYLGATPYCEKIKMSESGKFLLGAWVKNGTTAWTSSLLKMKLYDLDGDEVASCNLPKPTAEGGEISCVIQYYNKIAGEYYVCIKADKTTYYITKTENKKSCGFYGYPGEETEYNDYYIFAKAAKFENIGSFTLNQKKYKEQGNSGDLADIVYDYIDYKYEGDCTDGCAIPIKLKAFGNSNIGISNIKLSYSTSAGLQTPETKIYDAGREAAKISSDSMVLDLAYSNITVPDDYGEKEFKLYLDGKKILSWEIEVEKIPAIKSLSPTIVSAALPTKFNVVAESPEDKEIVSYRWDFGDGYFEETAENSITHTYSSIGDYVLNIEVEDEDGGMASKEFSIRV
ncbi:MAG: PKD domain-containing protein, partial [Nanoarchaeota archaeon]